MYIAPDRSFTATYPSFWRRLGAGAVDWAIASVLFLVASIVGGVFQAVGLVTTDAGDLRGIPGSALLLLSQAIVAAPVVGYFTAYWYTGSTLGMRAVDIEVVTEATGRSPGWPRALARACVAFVIAYAVNTVYLVIASEPLDGYSSLERTVITASVVVVSAAGAAKAWMLVDEQRRSLLDRLFGLVYVEDLVFSRDAPLPWSGPLRADSRSQPR
ncbi:MAG: RDD family protein [Gaiellaceae bacterium]